MKPINAKRERGAALLALLAVIMLGASWFLVSRLNAESSAMSAVRTNKNAEVLKRAKQALIGYIAAQAVKTGENRPGALPCPEAPADFNDPANEGTVSYPCTLPKVGRFPWRTLGLDKLVDASGEPLWYVVSPGWAGANTVINSNSQGQLTVDGVANDSIALIIAPGPAFAVPAAAGCAAWNQVRSTTAPPDWRNYLECENATSPPDATFVTSGPSGSFNDQVIRVTASDIMPALEAAIANRIEREIVPALNTVYAPADWGFGGAQPLYPYAAPFASPGPGAGTSSFQGVAGTYQGLLPFNQTECTASASEPRCLPGLIAFQSTPAAAVEVFGYGYIQTQSCSWQPAFDLRECTGEYHEYDFQPWRPIRIEMTATLRNVAMGLRMLDSTKMTVEAKDNLSAGPWLSLTPSYTIAMNNGSVFGKPAGSVTITFGATLPNIDTMGWGTYADFRLRIDRRTIADHTLLDPNDGTTGWFARNEWFRLAYYAVAAGHTAGTLPPACTTGTNCLSVANVTPAGAQRAILILAGSSINSSARPSATLSDYLEFGNTSGSFERQTVTAVPPISYADTGVANVYVVAAVTPTAGATFQFKAANANTGISTLATPATGTRSLVNLDGSNLAASSIQANAAVQVLYDGTKFLLGKRPFNDRVVVVGSN